MAEAFTMFEKFGDVCKILKEDDRKDLCYAICMYGMYGEEIELDYMLKALFMSLKEDIDNSKEARKRGAQGGRPKKTPEVAETEKPEVSGSEKPEVIETKKPGVSGKTRKSKTQSKPNQARPSQVKPERESAHAGAGSSGMLDPPTVEEVDVYAKTNCLNVDAERFVSTYAAQGWLMGNGLPMKDWRAALMKWSVNDETQRKAGKEVTPDAFTAYSNAW